jgi:hypothetical protein
LPFEVVVVHVFFDDVGHPRRDGLVAGGLLDPAPRRLAGTLVVIRRIDMTSA